MATLLILLSQAESLKSSMAVFLSLLFLFSPGILTHTTFLNGLFLLQRVTPYTEMSLAQGLHYFKWWLLFIGCFLTLLEIIYHWQTQIYVTLYCVSFPSWPPCFLMHTQSVGCTRTRTLSFFCLLSSKAKTIIYRLWDQMFVDWIQLPWYVRCKFNSCWCSESCFSVKKL